MWIFNWHQILKSCCDWPKLTLIIRQNEDIHVKYNKQFNELHVKSEAVIKLLENKKNYQLKTYDTEEKILGKQ